jgi:pyruvate kinase
VPPDLRAFAAGRAALDRNTDALLGARPANRVSRIMVTLPSEAAQDGDLVRRLAVRGMDVARINGAHDDVDAWEAMARHVRAAGEMVGRPIAISVDLPGPKVRTGPIARGPAVVKARPLRDLRGVAISPARVDLVGEVVEGSIPVGADWLARRRVGDELSVVDTRGSHRTLTIAAVGDGAATAEVWDTTYVESGMTVRCGEDPTLVGELPSLEQFHVLRPGDVLEVVARPLVARPWHPGMDGHAVIACTEPAAVWAAAVGDRVAIDDGRFVGIVDSVGESSFTVCIEDTAPKGAKLRSGKGINLPDTSLPVPMLTEDDDSLLAFAVRSADILALSFLRHEDDIDEITGRLEALGGDHVGLVLKVETIPAFERLPEIVLRAMLRPRVGVMIARGDLAVETSYERLAELQEELLWLCEAARVPAIWATQVLDQLARTGRPSRAEVTDAAMAQRAECIMLNKGPHVETAIAVLDEIITRMGGHQRKKTSLLRPLRSWWPDD